VTADHGEEFGEHGIYLHGNSLYLASLEVPLIIRQPGRVPAGQSVEAATSLRDLAATITDLAGIRDSSLPGRSLARFWNGAADSTSRDTLLMELNFSPRLPPGLPISLGSMRSVLLEDHRLIRNGDGTEEMYDFFGDPAEKSNLAPEPASQDLLTRLRGALQAKVPARRPAQR
jgi:arylsulfatase A-like enzyme